MEKIAELIDYNCGDCGGDRWEVKLIHSSDGSTYLAIICANERCVQAKKKALGMSQEETLFWDEFDVTGQVEHHGLTPLGKSDGIMN